MACSLSNLTQISAINGISARWKVGCTTTNINDVTFFPVGKRLQPMVGLMSSYQRRRNGLVVKAVEESTTNQTEILKSMSLKMLRIVDRTDRQVEVSLVGQRTLEIKEKPSGERGVLNITVTKSKVQPGSPNLLHAEFKNEALSIAIPERKMKETVTEINLY